MVRANPLELAEIQPQGEGLAGESTSQPHRSARQERQQQPAMKTAREAQATLTKKAQSPELNSKGANMELQLVAQSILAELIQDYNATADYWHTLRHSRGYAINDDGIDREMLGLEARAGALRAAMEIVARQARIEFNPVIEPASRPAPKQTAEIASFYDKPAPPARQRYT